MKTKNFFRLGLVLATVLSLSSLMGCMPTITNATSHDMEIINKYFTPQEQKVLAQRLQYDGITSRAVLGETTAQYLPFYGMNCGVTIYDTEIAKYYNGLDQETKTKYHLTFDTIRDKVLIHELCHVLYPENAHDLTWRDSFEGHLHDYVDDNAYCWEYFFNAYIASYENGTAVEYYRAVLPLPN